MKLLKTKLFPYKWAALAAALLFAFAAGYVSLSRLQAKRIVIESQETGTIYAECSVKAGDEISFQWEHSFEHIPWYEYYEVMKDGSFLLHTIAVAGFGAGIPAEMDCTYRYEDGMIYMDDIESSFPQFNWFNSQTALKEIKVNGAHLIYGSDMPHHEKMALHIK